MKFPVDKKKVSSSKVVPGARSTANLRRTGGHPGFRRAVGTLYALLQQGDDIRADAGEGKGAQTQSGREETAPSSVLPLKHSIGGRQHASGFQNEELGSGNARSSEPAVPSVDVDSKTSASTSGNLLTGSQFSSAIYNTQYRGNADTQR